MSRQDGTRNLGRVDAEPTEDARDSVLQRVVTGVADATDAEPTDLPPLYETIDPDVLEKLAENSPPPENEPVYLRFSYCGCTVIVDSDGTVTVTEDGDEPV